MATVNLVANPAQGTSSFAGTLTGDDLRVVKGDLMTQSSFAVHLVNRGAANNVILTSNGFYIVSMSEVSANCLLRLLSQVFSKA